MSFFSARYLLFILLATMKFTCFAEVSEKGRTCYTWGKEQSAVILYNFPKPPFSKNPPCEGKPRQGHVCEPRSERSPSVRADGAWAEQTWHHQPGKTNQVIANSYWQRFCSGKFCSYTSFCFPPWFTSAKRNSVLECKELTSEMGKRTGLLPSWY